MSGFSSSINDPTTTAPPGAPAAAHAPITATDRAKVEAQKAVEGYLELSSQTAPAGTVDALQRALNILGASPKLTLDTTFGPKTEGAVRDFLARDLPVLERGAGTSVQERAAVSQLQRALNVLGAKLEVDGHLGPSTVEALSGWQRSLAAANPSPEGIVTHATWNALLVALVAKLDRGNVSLPSPPPTMAPSVAQGLPPPATSGVSTPPSNNHSSPTSVTAPSQLPAPTAEFSAQRAYDVLLPQLEAATSPAEQMNLRDALRRYVTAYANFTRENPQAVRGQFGLLVNFGARNDTSGRGFILDMKNLALVRGPMPVSHGHGARTVDHTLTAAAFQKTYGSSGSPFSNKAHTEKSSLGVYTTFPLSGLHADKYVRVGLNGQSAGFNDNARERGVYMHGVPNVGFRTQGCPGFTLQQRPSSDGVRESDNAAVQRLLEGEPSFVFLDAPVASWYQGDRWVRGS